MLHEMFLLKLYKLPSSGPASETCSKQLVPNMLQHLLTWEQLETNYRELPWLHVLVHWILYYVNLLNCLLTLIANLDASRRGNRLLAEVQLENQHREEWGFKRMNMALLVVLDNLLWVSQKLLNFWYFHMQKYILLYYRQWLETGSTLRVPHWSQRWNVRLAWDDQKITVEQFIISTRVSRTSLNHNTLSNKHAIAAEHASEPGFTQIHTERDTDVTRSRTNLFYIWNYDFNFPVVVSNGNSFWPTEKKISCVLSSPPVGTTTDLSWPRKNPDRVTIIFIWKKKLNSFPYCILPYS